MNIGDKVRLLRGTEEGVIVKIVNDNIVEIEIEDGFSFPVMKNEVVLVHKAEADYFKKEAAPVSTSQKVFVKPTAQAEKGIYLGFEPKGDLYDVLLVNNTDYDLAFKIDELLKGTTNGLHAGYLPAKTFQQTATKSVATFENWADMHFTFIYFQKGIYKVLPVLTKKVSFNSSAFISKKAAIPLTSKEGHVYQLDEIGAKPDPKEIVERMFSTQTPAADKPLQRGTSKQAASAEIDLHLEKLVDAASALPSTQALSYQLAIFEKELDTAIAAGLDEITFIHGVGNGILKEEIHKRLSKMKNISYFQDARKERFGYGATLVKIKS